MLPRPSRGQAGPRVENDAGGGTEVGRREAAEHPGHLGRRHRDHEPERYSDGLMGYRTPNIDRIADEGMRFTDSYGEQSCTAGRSSFITGQSVFRTGLSKVGMPGADVGLQAEDVTIAELLKPLGLRDRAVRQEPPRRPEQVPADRPRLRRVLRQPLPPQRRGGAGDRQLAAGGGLPGLQRALPAARRPALLGDRHRRRHRGRALRARRPPADRGHRSADAASGWRRSTTRCSSTRSTSSSARPPRTRRSSAGSTPRTCTCARTRSRRASGRPGAGSRPTTTR